MPGKLKVKIVAGRHLPVMDRASDLTDAFVEVCGKGGGRGGRGWPRRLTRGARAPAAGPARPSHLPVPAAAPPGGRGCGGPSSRGRAGRPLLAGGAAVAGAAGEAARGAAGPGPRGSPDLAASGLG